ncbi:hypothetical protein NCS56_00652400 [Fusarium sp. Ph1]|nr:hypothetical protein NCS56_00652400 [Fusarium sp. Ph1]
MRPATILSALAPAPFPTAAIINNQGSNATVARGHEVEARDATPAYTKHLEKGHLVSCWEDGSEILTWPVDKVGHGKTYYQLIVASLGNNYTLKFTITAPGLSVFKTLTSGTNTSFQVTKSGDGFQVKVE